MYSGFLNEYTRTFYIGIKGVVRKGFLTKGIFAIFKYKDVSCVKLGTSIGMFQYWIVIFTHQIHHVLMNLIGEKWQTYTSVYS